MYDLKLAWRLNNFALLLRVCRHIYFDTLERLRIYLSCVYVNIITVIQCPITCVKVTASLKLHIEYRMWVADRYSDCYYPERFLYPTVISPKVFLFRNVVSPTRFNLWKFRKRELPENYHSRIKKIKKIKKLSPNSVGTVWCNCLPYQSHSADAHKYGNSYKHEEICEAKYLHHFIVLQAPDLLNYRSYQISIFI